MLRPIRLQDLPISEASNKRDIIERAIRKQSNRVQAQIVSPRLRLTDVRVTGMAAVTFLADGKQDTRGGNGSANGAQPMWSLFRFEEFPNRLSGEK